MTSVTMNNSVDAYADESFPSQNFTGTKKLYVRALGQQEKDAFLYFTRPFPFGARIISATLKLRNGMDMGGKQFTTVSVRRIIGSWSANKVTWNNRPPVVGPPSEVTKIGNISQGMTWEFDVTQILQSAADGEPFYGFAFTANDDDPIWFHGIASGTGSARPTLTVEWVIPLDPPDQLSPANDRAVATPNPLLSFNYDADSDIDAVRVARAPDLADAPDPGAVAFSAWIPTSDAQVGWAEVGFTPVAEAVRQWWTIQIKTLDGQESPWAEWTSFYYQPNPGLTILQPDVDELYDTTPLIEWILAGATQRHYQVYLIDPELGTENVIWTNGRTTGTETSLVLPVGLLELNREYVVRVQVWDDIDREGSAEWVPYSMAEKSFTVVLDPAEVPVDSLVPTRVAPWHWTKLDWHRTVTPDWFDVYIGNRMVQRLDPDEVRVSPENYSFVSRVASPREDSVWMVTAVTGYHASQNNPTVTTNYRPTSAWLSELDGSDPLMLLNYERDQSEVTAETIHETVGGGPPVLIKQGKGRIVGSMTGILSGDAMPGVNAKEEKARFNRLRKGEGRDLLLTVLDETIICFIANTNIVSYSWPDTLYYQISFDYYQTVIK